MKKRSILTAIVAGILSIGLIGCGGSNSSNGDDKVIKVGVSPVPHEEIMEVAKPLLEAKGYKVEIVEFTDYVLPNTSLENGELDANYFQHIAYLNSFNADNGTHLTYTAEIHLEPMGAFSKKYKSVDELLSQALKYKTYWKKKGGITVSGGEPLLQIDFLIEFFKKAKAKGVHVTLDTSGNPFTREEPFFSKFNELMKVTDLVILDIKQMDDNKHKILTGWSNSNILDMARYLSEIDQQVWIRHVLVPGGSDNDEQLKKLNDFIKTLNNVDRVEVLPYHTLGTFKWEELGIEYPLKDILPPTKERVENAKDILNTSEYTKYLTR